MPLQKIRNLAKYAGIPFRALWVKKTSGLENLPEDGPFIIAPNHCSYIEHFLIGAVVIPKIRHHLLFLAKKEHFDGLQDFWHGLWKKYTRYIPIDRSKGEKALETAAEALKEGNVLIVYPEGTRSLTGKIQRGKTGVARLTLLAKVPVIPLGIIGTFEILPKGKTIPRLKKAELHFGNPLTFERSYGKPTTKKLLRTITTTIMKEIARLSQQKYPFD